MATPTRLKYHQQKERDRARGSQEATEMNLYSSDTDGLPPIMFPLGCSSLLVLFEPYHSVHVPDRSAQVLLIPWFNSVVRLAGGPSLCCRISSDPVPFFLTLILRSTHPPPLSILTANEAPVHHFDSFSIRRSVREKCFHDIAHKKTTKKAVSDTSSRILSEDYFLMASHCFCVG